jgi:hypothetical protein
MKDALVKPPFGAELILDHPHNIGLGGCWLFNEQGGNTAKDYGPRSLIGTHFKTGTAGNPIAYGTSPYGPVLPLDGNNNWVSVAWSSRHDPIDRYSVEFLFKTQSPLQGSFKGLAAKWLGVGNGTIGVWKNSSNGIHFRLEATTVDSNDVLTTNTWYHVFCTWDGSTMRIYINGVLQSNTASKSSFTAVDGFWDIGGRVDASEFIQCDMSHCRVWNRRCLETEMVLDIYRRPFDGFSDCLINRFYSFPQLFMHTTRPASLRG